MVDAREQREALLEGEGREAGRRERPPAPSRARTRRRERGTQSLTEQEIAVVKHIARGLSNQEIARELSVTQNTVRNHLSNIFMKLDVTNRTHALVRAVLLGLVEIGG